jgi:hypothetical protein
LASNWSTWGTLTRGIISAALRRTTMASFRTITIRLVTGSGKIILKRRSILFRYWSRIFARVGISP